MTAAVSSSVVPPPYRTLLVTLTFPPLVGGLETMMHHMMRNMPGEVTILASWTPGCEAFDRDQSYRVIRIRSPRWTPLRSFVFMWHGFLLLRRHPVDHIQSSNMFAGLISMVLGKAHGVTYSVYALGAEIALLNTQLRSRLYRWLFSRVLRNAVRVLSISDFTSAEAIRAGVPAGRVFKIPNGIDTTVLDNFSKGQFEAFRRRVGETLDLRGRQVVLTVARLAARKGHDTVIRAMAILASDTCDAVYVIVGGGPRRPELEALVRQLGLEGCVKFAGRVPDEEIVYYYHLADIFIMASRHIVETADVEGFGMVFLEANYCGKPVVGGNTGGIPDAVVDGKTGYLVNPTDPADIAEKLKTLLLSPQARREMGDYGRRRVIERFSHKQAVAKILEGLGVDGERSQPGRQST